MTSAPSSPAPAPAPAPQPSAGAAAAPGVEAGLIELVKVLQQLERPDLAQRATAAAARLKRPSTVVCVVGEFKQGKSSLVNGLLGRDDLPGRRRPRDLGDHARALRRRGGGRRCGAAARTASRRRPSRSPIDEPAPTGSARPATRGNEKRRRAGRDRRAEPAAEAGAGHRRHARHGRARRRPRRRDARVPSLRRRADVRVRRVGRAVGARRSSSSGGPPSCARPCCSRRPRSTSTRSGSASPSSTAATSIARACASRWSRVSSVVRAEALARKDRELNERSRFPVLVKELGDKVVAPAKAGAAERSAGDGALDRGDGAHRARGREAAARRSRGDEGGARPARGGQGAARAPPRPGRAMVDDRRRPRRRPVEQRQVRLPRRRCATISRNMDELIESLHQGRRVGRHGPRPPGATSPTRSTSAFVALEEGRVAIRDEVVEHARRGGPPGRPRSGLATCRLVRRRRPVAGQGARRRTSRARSKALQTRASPASAAPRAAS